MATEGPPRLIIVIGVLMPVLFIIFGIGVWCLCFVYLTQAVTHEEEYMDKCKDYRLDEPCAKFIPSPHLENCVCLLGFTLKEDFKGPVTLYYELVDFDQTKSSYANSRDDNQLRGNLDAPPAQSCGNYSYVGEKPIFPCGEVADSMFSDTYTPLQRGDENLETVPVVYTDLLTADTPTFKNPPEEKLKNFATPKSWKNRSEDNPWEKELKGVENPAFQAWMDTNLKRKPVWRVDQKGNFTDGLPAGNYTLTINIYYGVDRYAGVRKVILEGVTRSEGIRSLAWGVILLLLSLGGFLIGALYLIYIKLQHKPSTASIAATRLSDDKELPLLNRLRDRIRNMRSKD